jgi:hypothetical protein
MQPSKSLTSVRAALLVAALLASSAGVAKEPPLVVQPVFVLDANEYAAGVREHGLDADTRMLGWQLGDTVYFGRRHGVIDDFGFVVKRGDDQFSFTQKGIGWHRSLSFQH